MIQVDDLSMSHPVFPWDGGDVPMPPAPGRRLCSLHVSVCPWQSGISPDWCMFGRAIEALVAWDGVDVGMYEGDYGCGGDVRNGGRCMRRYQTG